MKLHKISWLAVAVLTAVPLVGVAPLALAAGDLTVYNADYVGNSSPASDGGAISYFDDGTITVTNSTFIGNSAGSAQTTHTPNGGAIAATQASSITISNSTFDNNSATGFGGALYYSGTGPVTIVDSVFTGNTAGLGGNAIYLADPAATLTLIGTYIDDADIYVANPAGYRTILLGGAPVAAAQYLGDPVTPVTVSITNSGNTAAAITSAALLGGGDLALAGPATTTVAAGATNTDYSITAATPLGVGTYTDTLEVTYDSGAKITVPISYEVKPKPILAADQTDLSFEPREVDTSSETRLLSVSGTDLDGIISYQLSGDTAAFHIDDSNWAAAQQLGIQYTPTTVASHQATLTILSRGAEPIVVQLSGSATVANPPEAGGPAPTALPTTGGVSHPGGVAAIVALVVTAGAAAAIGVRRLGRSNTSAHAA